MTTREVITEALQCMSAQREQNVQTCTWILQNEDKLCELELDPQVYIGLVYLNDLYTAPVTREKAMAVIQAFPGKWEKNTDCGEFMRYTLRLDKPQVSLHFTTSELPPCCKVVEETHTIPAREARTEVRKRIVCELPLPSLSVAQALNNT